MKKLLITAAILTILSGCSVFKEETGAPAYVRGIGTAGGEAYYLLYEDGLELYRSGEGGDEKAEEFPENSVSAVYGGEGIWYCLSDGRLKAFDCLEKSAEEICSVSAESLMWAADGYISAADKEGELIIKSDGSIVKRAENSPRKILSAVGDEVLHWDSEQNALCLYSCERDENEIIYPLGEERCEIAAGVISEETIYFAKTKLGLYTANIEDKTEVRLTGKDIIGLTEYGGKIIAAAKDGKDICFYLAEGDGLTEIAKWEGADYVVSGSLIMSFDGEYLAAALTDKKEIYFCKI